MGGIRRIVWGYARVLGYARTCGELDCDLIFNFRNYFKYGMVNIVMKSNVSAIATWNQLAKGAKARSTDRLAANISATETKKKENTKAPQKRGGEV